MEKMAGNQDRFSLKPVGESKHEMATQFRYQLFLEGHPLLEGWVQLTVYAQKSLLADLSFPQYNFQNPGIIEPFPTAKAAPGNELFYHFTDGQWRIIRAESHHSLTPAFESSISYYDLENNRLGHRDWLDYFSPGPDSIIKAAVFRPDPSSRLQLAYGGSFKDRADSNSVMLSQALDTCLMPVLFFQDTFQLRNNRFEMGEFSDPVKPHARQISPDFRFTRDNPLFEEVNAFYHLNQYRGYVDSLGFQEYANYSLRVDAHGMNGADQSAYSPIMDVLAFGEGGVDDAEDATVLIHEYSHALANDANPVSNTGQERRALEEGICDYLAGSYCKKISTWNWQDIYKWDGHNEFWDGRTVMSTKHYPEDLLNQIHQDGEIWSSAMMHIELQIGREATHKILFSIFPSLAPNLRYNQAAYLFLKADTALYGTTHGTTIRQIFQDKGIGTGPIIVENRPYMPNVQTGFFGFWDTDGNLRLKNLPPESSEIFLFDAQGKEIYRCNNPSGQTQVMLATRESTLSLFIVKVSSGKTCFHRSFSRL